MDPDVDQSIIACLISEAVANTEPAAGLFQAAVGGPQLGELPRSRYRLGDKWGLNTEGSRVLGELVYMLWDEAAVRGQRSYQQVDAAVLSAIVEAKECGKAPAVVASELISSLGADSQQYEVIFPLRRIRFRPGPLLIGCVTFYRGDAPEVTSRWQKAVEAADKDPIFCVMGGFPPKADSYAAVTVEAAPKSEIAVAEEYLDEALDYLKCYAAFELPMNNYHFGRIGTGYSDKAIGASFDPGGNISLMSIDDRAVGPNLDIAPVNKGRMCQHWGLDSLSRLLATARWSRLAGSGNMTARLTLALHWSAMAHERRQLMQKIAYYCTALDTIFFDYSKKRVSRDEFGKMLEFVVAKWCDNHDLALDRFAQKNQDFIVFASMEEWGKKMYEARCECVHDGKLEPSLEISRASHLWPFVALATIATVAENIQQWRTYDDFLQDFGCA